MWNRIKDNMIFSVVKQNLLSVLLLVFVLVVFLFAVHSARETQEGEGKKLVEQAVTRAMVSCYAIEGFYPLDITYLMDHYGLVIDENRYQVVYDAFASNIMPQVFVFDR